ncbi:MAG: choice-of-anchor J domain-containing protein [Bacteroidota bacterium]
MKLRLLIAFLVVAAAGLAQPFTALYPFSGVATNTSGTTDPTPVPTAPGVTFGSFSATGTPPNPNAAGRFSFIDWALGATNGSNTFSGSVNTAEYYQVTITPQANFTLNLDSLTFLLQRSGTGIRQYSVRSSVDAYGANLAASINPANSSLQVVPPNNIFQVDDASTGPNYGSTITLTGFTNITTPISFRFFAFNAEGAGGTFSIDSVRVFGQAVPVAGSAVITVSTTGFVFASTNAGSETAAQSYTVLGENLVANVDLSVDAPFSISTDSLSFVNNLSLTPAEVAVPKKIFVKFAPTVAGTFTDTVLHISSGATNKIVSLSGEGINPGNFTFNFNTCTNLGVPGAGFIAYSVVGAQAWNCTTFGQNTSNGVNMNGFSGGSQDNEDWLISPPLDLSGFSLPVLSFYSRGEFSGLPLELLVSTNYSGTGNPNAASWTKLNADFPVAGSNVWTLSDNINLNAYKAFPKVYIAYKYISSPTQGAPRWTLDDIAITNRTQLFFTTPATIDLGEASVGSSSAGQAILLQAIGYGDITITAPAGFQVSANNVLYSGSIVVPQAIAEAGTTIYVRFTPSAKELRVTGQLSFTGTSFNSTRINLIASSYPKSETLDVVTYNMKFFGSNPTNNATEPQKDIQKNNMKVVFDHLNADVIGIQEVSSDSLMNKLIEILPGYASVLSHRWSQSYNPPDPTFPPQKVGFIYKTSTMQLLETRVMFESLYDSLRANTATLPGYPTGTSSSFWSSGRLPFMATFKATINGISKTIRIISIHAKAGSAVSEDYQRRVYDTRVLKDSLNLYYATDSLILVGDYNDDIDVAEYMGNPSPYSVLLNEADKYKGATLPLSMAGTLTYVGGGGNGPIDHQIITNELEQYVIPNSVATEDPRNYLANYSSTTSDHLPVYVRYDLTNIPLPVTITRIDASLIGKEVSVNWTTATELNSNYFVVERSADGVHFGNLGQVKAAGNSVTLNHYRFADTNPIEGVNYYRIKTVDADGRFAYTPIVKVTVSKGGGIVIRVYPNPVTTGIQVYLGKADATANWQLINGDGKILLQGKGNAGSINTAINQKLNQLHPGMYLLKTEVSGKISTAKFIKE